MKKSCHYIIFGVTLLFTLACGWFMTRVNVNSDMTKYLPDDSQMKQGLEIVMNEFDASQMQAADVKAMFSGLNETEQKEVATKLAFYDDIKAVSYRNSEDGKYTLYEMVVPKSVDQKSLGKTIRKDFGRGVVVETGQDGATPPFAVIIIAAAVIIGILLLMSKSWLDPIILLSAIGIAVVINVGTNAFLPSVSITTNYIGSILQLVLSLDYAIILMNRYRQELRDDRELYQSMNIALRRSCVSILSSALTTVVGLLMLAFMRLKIGLDMGIVLAKGVVCSLFCTFTILPSLIMLFDKALRKTSKRIFVLPTERLGRFATNHKIPLAIFSVVLFGTSFYFSKKTGIYFSTNGESKIETIFPKSNIIVSVYDTSEEMNVIPLADSLKTIDNVKTIISYPTLLKQQYTADELSAYILRLSTEMAEFVPPMDEGPLELLSPEVMRVVYYLRTQSADTLTIGFPELITFIKENCLNNPMFADIIDANIRNQMALLDVMLTRGNNNDDDDDDVAVAAPIVTPQKEPEVVVAKPVEEVAKPVEQTTVQEGIRVIDFTQKLHTLYGIDETYQLTRLTDTTLLHTSMTARQMSEYIGSTVSQTKMVYSFSDGGRRMTPIAYVNFLADDLFNRKALSDMVSESQKNELRTRAKIMNYANKDARIPAAEMSSLLVNLGININEERVNSIANPRWASQRQAEQENAATVEPDVVEPIVVATPVVEVDKKAARAKAEAKRKADRQAALMDELMYSNKTYTATAMTKNFHVLGEDIDPIFVNLLYNYYGSVRDYDTTMHMSLEEMLSYVADTMVYDNRFKDFLDDNSRNVIMSTRNQLAGSIGMLSNAKHSLLVIQTNLPDESEETYAFVNTLQNYANQMLEKPHYFVGESIMFSEMKNGFNHEMTVVTLLTVLAIFLIVAISFRSLLVPTILVMTVMTAVYVNVICSGLISGEMLYLAYLIVQSILMGATIDYGILFTNYYKENRHTMEQYEAVQQAYRGAIGTIMTSGLIVVFGPGVMAALVDDVAIASIVSCISVGAAVAILLILLVLPGVLVAFDKWVVGGLFGKKKAKKA